MEQLLTAQSEDHETAYCQSLIASGLSPAMAADVAHRLAVAGQLPSLDLSSDRPGMSAQPSMPEGDGSSALISRLQQKLTHTGAEIGMEGPSPEAIGFMHTVMCQVGLPRRAVPGRRYERISGGVGLLVTGGDLWDGEKFVEHPIPYGAMPRIVLAHLNSEALRQRSPEVDVGPSASAFLKSLGYENHGGARGSYTMFKKQVQALASCSVRLGYNVGPTAYTFKSDLIDDFAAWTHFHQPGADRVMWPKKITFSTRYYNSLIEHAVPLDLRAVHALRGSSLALDIYAMMAERLHRLDKPLLLHWASLREQFGHEFTGESATRNFKKKFLPALKNVMAVYPAAKIRVVKTGISLRPSSPPVPPRPTRHRLT